MPIADILICDSARIAAMRCSTRGTILRRILALAFNWSRTPTFCPTAPWRPLVPSLYVGCKGEEVVLVVIYKVTFVMEEEHPSSQFL